jgi:hypothetical protein
LTETETKVSYQGSVLESCALVREKFADSLKKDFPKAEVVAPRFKPVVGAFLLGCRALGWQLDENHLIALEKAEIE